jgi:DNA-binding PucR family transcriptional regulator
MENYVEEVLGTLIEYDEGNGTDFVDFMKICIENNGNIQQMANSMYVHRNTVHYKINKIREISGINLSESEDMMKVMICLLIMQL